MGEFKGEFCELVGFLRRGRIQDREVCEMPESPCVLLGLGGMGPRVIGNQQDKSALYPNVGKAHQGIGRNVQAHLLHGNKRFCPRIRGPHSRFKRHFFVAGPFGVDSATLSIPDNSFQSLGRRGPRIPGSHLDSGFYGPKSNGLISH